MSKTNYLLDDEQEENNKNVTDLDDLDIQTRVDAPTKILNDSLDNDEHDHNDGVVISKNKLAIISSLLETIKDSHDKIMQLLAGTMDHDLENKISIGQTMTDKSRINDTSQQEEGRIIEGVFDGENMIGPDGKQYSVPANYASKSKLVEGDILKLTITPKGTFIYKQIGPIERNRVIATLKQTENGSFVASSDDREWKLITASVTYYKGRDGDEIVILIPQVGESKWAAVENIVKKSF